MRLGRLGKMGLYVALALVAFTGFPAEIAAAGDVKKIEESALDAKIGDKNNRLALVFMAAWCAPCIDEFVSAVSL